MIETQHSKYGRTAWFYERAAHMFSGGQIRASKQWQIQWLKEGQRVLYVGAGSGEDVVMAARLGAQVTVVELSQEMLARLQAKLQQLNMMENVNLICGDAYEHKPDEPYAVVLANYFLNVFSEETMPKMLAHLSTLLGENGLLLIADFAPASTNCVSRFFQKIYYFSAVAVFNLLANNPFHPLYSYQQYMEKLGLIVEREQGFPVFGFGPKWYSSMKAIKATSTK